jgi:hypothetical protein
MKERPILFNTEMVQAILDGRKTQTRRLTKLKTVNENPNWWRYNGTLAEDIGLHFMEALDIYGGSLEQFHKIKSPYGQSGDLLWVRETFYKPKSSDGYIFKASAEPQGWKFEWKPSIHMPKDAARIWLQVEEVKIERLQEISNNDALEEGIERKPFDEVRTAYKDYHYNTINMKVPIASFQTLWDGIHSTYHWDLNPWVWVVKFKVISTTGKPALK